MPSPDATRVRTYVLDGDVVQGAGVVQGGIVAGIVGEALEAFGMDIAAPGSMVELETLDICIDRAVLPGPCSVHGVLRRAGRSLQVWDASLLSEDGRTVATARATHRVRQHSP